MPSTEAMEEFHLAPKAPLVGPHHKKSQSLAGFDPLLGGSVQPLTAVSPEKKDASPEQDEQEEEEDNAIVVPVNQEEVNSALREIASELGKSSPNRSLLLCQQPPSKQPQSDENKNNRSVTPVSSPAAKTPPRSSSSRRILASTTSPGERKGSLFFNRRNKKQQHNRTKSLPVISMPWSKKSPARNGSRSNPTPTHSRTHSRASSRASLSSDMLQELWDLQEQQQPPTTPTPAGSELSLPSLAKPRPTSFLTGQEVVLSSEADATEWQLDIPVKTEFNYTCRASCFLETYRKEQEGVLDLNNLIGCTSQDLAFFVGGKPSPNTLKLGETHRPVIETLLECGTDLLQVQAYMRSKPVDGDASSFREVFIVERQRQFLCVLRGTSLEQAGKLEKQPDTMKLFDNKNVSVFADRCKAFQELEPQLFGKLDQLMEDNPFCDFVFAGHGFGGAMATLAAYRYAWARPELRVAALVTGSVKVGLSDFRLSANSLPNLKIARVDMGQSPRAQNNHAAGVHAGHTIRLNPSKMNAQVRAFKFSDSKPESGKLKLRLKSNKEKTVSDYVNALDDLADVWVKDYYREDGAGVLGKDNEKRLVV